ncbi:MAG: glycoside hydrolase family 3 C-terminal domain-containing protein [Eggerthellaceae bacterium]|nr:glycoside hydrolase family 3 C-terminal domain-containing protein [Eggerthellaceae bacterium]
MTITFARNTDEVTQFETEGRRIAREAAQEAVVLLENDGALPLRPSRIALFGTGASMTIAGGTGSGEVNVRHTVSVREGLEAAGFEIATTARLEAYERTWHEGRALFIASQRAKMRKPTPKTLGELIAMEYRAPDDSPITIAEVRSLDADACIYVLSRQSGEGLDRVEEPGSYLLTERELADIRLCATEFETTIVVLNVGAPIDVSWRREIEGINAIVLMGQLGMEGGHALSDVITGATPPSGKLAVSWPESLDQIPFSDSYGACAADPDVADYREGIYVGYRYYTSFDVQPAYPFGYGLGYTPFQQELKTIECNGQSLKATVSVQNDGTVHSGKHVVQLYARLPKGAMPKERLRLIAFGKTEALSPGEACEIELSFMLRDLASYDESSAETVLEDGKYVLCLGTSSADTSSVAVITVGERIALERHRSLCASPQPIAELAASPDNPPQTGHLPQLFITADDIATKVHVYGRAANVSPELEELVDALAPKQKIDLCVGTGLFVGKQDFCVPGAVGHTTTALVDKGIPNIELCDGPAGIRLQRRSSIDSKGNIKPLDPPLSLYEVLPSIMTRFLYGNPEKDRVVYQFVTGFPAASSVAQTWNTDLVRRIGETVGREMHAVGVTYWLAPALNIVRHPLCGRNFEYYSEDPLISGKMAAAVTQGVQSVPGCFACCKHFAANNQETNRNTASSNVDERVLREVYLRGFEIAVREARPASIMSAYNKISGVYCSENRELLTSILRDEWGFDGVVMTDWFATRRGYADERKAIMAGVDLIMPGGNRPRLLLSRGLKTGEVDVRALDAACARVLEKTLVAACSR